MILLIIFLPTEQFKCKSANKKKKKKKRIFLFYDIQNEDNEDGKTVITELVFLLSLPNSY